MRTKANKNEPWETGERLRKRREAVGLEQGQVAEYEKMSKSYVSQLETGRNRPNWDLLRRLARRYKTSADYILELTDDSRPPLNRKFSPESEKILEYLASMTDRSRAQLLAIARVMAEEDEKWQSYIFGTDAAESLAGEIFMQRVKQRLATLTAELGSADDAIAVLQATLFADEVGDDSGK